MPAAARSILLQVLERAEQLLCCHLQFPLTTGRFHDGTDQECEQGDKDQPFDPSVRVDKEGAHQQRPFDHAEALLDTILPFEQA